MVARSSPHCRSRPGDELEAGVQEGGSFSASSRENILSKICAKSSCETTSSQCSGQTRSMRGRTPSAPRSRWPPRSSPSPDRDAEKVGADAVAHGATGKATTRCVSNIGYTRSSPSDRYRTVAGMGASLARGAHRLCEQHQIPIAKDKARAKRHFRRQNCAWLSEGQVLGGTVRQGCRTTSSSRTPIGRAR